MSMKAPHTYVLLVCILLGVVVLTYLVPAGTYERILDEETGQMIVLPGTFHFVDSNKPSFFDIFLAIQRGYVDAADIMFLIVFAYSYIYLLTQNGTLDSSIRVLIKRMGSRTHFIIPVCMMIFGLLGATLGIFEEVYGLVPVFIGIMTALGYDTLVGGSVVYIGVATGFSAALTNPFSVGIAQSIAQVPANSGLGYRAVVFLVFQSVSIWYVMRYARRIKQDPTKSILYETAFQPPAYEDKDDAPPFLTHQKLCLLLFFFTIGILIYGTACLNWYINEIAAMFLMMMVITGLVSGYTTAEICDLFIDATKKIISSILVIGLTRGIVLLMQDAMISDTVVFGLAKFLDSSNKALSAVGMLFLQNIINFFITGSSSQATITMPIMAPVADIVGIERETAILCYCFGDGFSDMFWPTACSLECGLMGISLDKWYRFIMPLFFIMIFLQLFFVVCSVSCTF